MSKSQDPKNYTLYSGTYSYKPKKGVPTPPSPDHKQPLPDLLRQLPVCLVFQTLLDFQGPVMKIVKQLRAELKTNDTQNKDWGRLLQSSSAFQVKITIRARNKFYVIKILKETRTG